MPGGIPATGDMLVRLRRAIFFFKGAQLYGGRMFNLRYFALNAYVGCKIAATPKPPAAAIMAAAGPRAEPV